MKKVIVFSLMLMLTAAMPVFAGVTLSTNATPPATYVIGFMPDPGHTTGNLSTTNDLAGEERMYGQEFTTVGDFSLGAVSFLVSKNLTFDPATTIEIAILDAGNAVVAGPFSCSYTAQAENTWETYTFDEPIALAAATLYKYVYTYTSPVAYTIFCHGDRSGANYAGGRMVSSWYNLGDFPNVSTQSTAGRDMYFAVQEYSGVNLPPTVNPTSDPAAPANPANPQSGEGIHLVETDPNQALLDAGASDPEGDPLTYAWTIASQPGTATLDDSTIATPTLLNADVLGDYVVDVVVTATAGDMTPVPGSVTVTVLDNWAPNCNILDDESPGTIHYDEEVRWNADKGDPDGLNALLTFEWTSDPVGVKFIDPATGLADNTVEDPNVALITPDLANVGTYEVQLLVTDPGGLTVTDVRTLTVIANVDPIADAGDETAFISIADGGTLALNGVVPADDGYPHDPGVMTITWEADDVLVGITDPSAAVTTADFNAAGTGVYTLTLTADDGGGNPAVDTIVVTVTPYAVAFTTLAPTDDTFVRANVKIYNFGGENSIDTTNSLAERAASGVDVRLGLLKFDIHAGVPGVVEGATFRIKSLDPTAAASITAMTYGPSGEWFEGNGLGNPALPSDADTTGVGITWETCDLVQGAELASIAPVPDDTMLDFDVSGMVMEADGKVTLGLETPGDPATVNWRSKDGSADAPSLIVRYQAHAASASLPVDGATGVDPDVLITWTPGDGADTEEVYFDGGLVTLTDPNVYDPSPTGALDEGTVYTYRIVSKAGGVIMGETPVYTFTTAVNTPPVVDAGPETATVVLAEDPILALNGTVTDDGLPYSATVTYSWDDGGTGVIDALELDALVTSADFTGMAAGTYTLTLNADDTALTAADSIVVTVIPYAQATVTLTPVDDTFVRSTRGNWNFGGANTLGIENSLANQASDGMELRLGLLKFDIHGQVPGAIVESEVATLRMFSKDPMDETRILAMTYGPTGEWFEGNGIDNSGIPDTTGVGITWNTFDLVQGAELDYEAPIEDESWYEFDVSGMLLEGDGKVTIGMDAPAMDIDGKEWRTKEGTEVPELIVTYQVHAASALVPVQNQVNVHPKAMVTWTRGVGADTEEVYFDGELVDTIATGEPNAYDPTPGVDEELVLGATHTCQIISMAGGEIIGETPVHSFTVVVLHPDVPVNLSPEDGAPIDKNVNGEIDDDEVVSRPVVFNFTAGENATATGQHNLLVDGEDPLENVLPDDPNTSLALALKTEYSWQIEAVGDGGTYLSAATSFTTEDCEFIDDFEDGVWAGGEPNGIIVDNGDQSMNVIAGTDATMIFDGGKDFNVINAGFLRVRFHGDSDNVPGFMSLILDDGLNPPVIVEYDGSDTDIVTESYANWQNWRIDLGLFTGIDLGSVDALTIGVDNGTVCIDDVTVCAPMCVEDKIPGDFNGADCMGDPNEMILLVQDWLLQAEDVSAGGDITSDLLVHFDFEAIVDPNATVAGDEYYANLGSAASVGLLMGTVAVDADGPVGFGNAADCAGGLVQLDTVQDVNDLVTAESGFTYAFWARSDAVIDPATGRFDVTDSRFVTGGGTELYWKFRDDGQYAVNGLGGDFIGYAHGADDSSKIIGVWNHCAYTTDFVTSKLYVDGVLVATSPNMDVDEVKDLQVLKIGNREASNPNPVKIDDFRLYNRTLTQEEILSIAGIAGPVTQPVVSGADVNDDGKVNLEDFTEVAAIWLEEVVWP